MPAFDKTDPLGWDLSCFDELSPNLSLVSGIECLTQALARRLRSKLWYDDAYGLPLEDLLNSGITPSVLADVSSAVERQLLLDERVRSVKCTGGVSGQLDDITLTLSISGLAITGEAFSFTGVLSPDGVVLSRIA